MPAFTFDLRVQIHGKDLKDAYTQLSHAMNKAQVDNWSTEAAEDGDYEPVPELELERVVIVNDIDKTA